MSFYGKTAEEANNTKFAALADQARSVLFSDPGRLTVGDYISSWLTDTARYQVSEVPQPPSPLLRADQAA